MFAYQHVLLLFVMILNPLLWHWLMNLCEMLYEVVFRNMALEPKLTLTCKKRAPLSEEQSLIKRSECRFYRTVFMKGTMRKQRSQDWAEGETEM